MIVIDASNLLLGRLSSIAAKQLLLGKSVAIINSEKAVISGSRRSIIEAAKRSLRTRTLGAQNKAPKHPRRPEGIIRRAVRGMLPYDKPKGRTAYRRLQVYIDIPEDLNAQSAITLPEAKVNKGTICLTVNEVAQNIGWNTLKEK
ncbi:MAG: 50S ribosomal protein L13 [Candidatus Bathyarchaeota archaeon]